MDQKDNTEYNYQMVVNIVADMVVEYLKATAHDKDKSEGNRERVQLLLDAA